MSKVYIMIGFVSFWAVVALVGIMFALVAVSVYRDRRYIRWPWQPLLRQTLLARPGVICALCGYQHGHAIGCANNPVDIAFASGVVVDAEPDGGKWKPLREPGNTIEHPDPYCGHMRRGLRKAHCARCMRAAYPGVPFEEAQRRYIASGVALPDGGRDGS